MAHCTDVEAPLPSSHLIPAGVEDSTTRSTLGYGIAGNAQSPVDFALLDERPFRWGFRILCCFYVFEIIGQILMLTVITYPGYISLAQAVINLILVAFATHWIRKLLTVKGKPRLSFVLVVFVALSELAMRIWDAGNKSFGLFFHIFANINGHATLLIVWGFIWATSPSRRPMYALIVLHSVLAAITIAYSCANVLWLAKYASLYPNFDHYLSYYAPYVLSLIMKPVLMIAILQHALECVSVQKVKDGWLR